MDNPPGPSGASVSVTEKKQKKPRLSYNEKMKIFELLESGMKQSHIARKFNISQAAITYLKTNQENLIRNKELLEQENINLNRKRFSSVINSDREKKLMEWFNQNRAAGISISGKVIQEAAVAFNESCNGPHNFKGGRGFLYKFQKRHSIHSLSSKGEKILTSNDAAAEFKNQFSSFITDFGYGLDQIYNADEFGLLWKALPGQTLIDNDKKSTPEWKLLKDRVTIMVCSNADGSHRLPLCMIGKSATPHCLIGLNKESLPVMYTNQRNALMDTTVFMKWYTEMFIPRITEQHKDSGKKCILLLDNAPIHPPAEHLNSISDICSVVYLPPHIFSLTQPMSQGVIEKFKRLYRRNMIRSLLMMESILPVEAFVEEINMYKCIMFAADAWNSIRPSNLSNAWGKILGQTLATNFPEEDDGVEDVVRNMQTIPQFENITYKEIISWFTHDDIYSGWEVVTPEEIISKEDISEDDYEEDKVYSTLTNEEAATVAESFEKWCFTRTDFTAEQLSVLRSVVSLANNIAYDEKFSKY